MNMRAFSIFLLTYAFFAVAPAAAGPKVNNGGGAWRCSAGGETRWMKTVDIATWNGTTVKSFPGKNAEEIFSLAKREVSLASPLFKKLVAQYDIDLTRIDFVNATFQPIGDAYLFVRPDPSTCAGGSLEFVQIANYVINDRLVISKPAWESPAFSELDKAAILLHELFYRMLRAEYGDENSLRARRLTELSLSTLDHEGLKADLEYVLDLDVPKLGGDQVAGFAARPRCVAAVLDQRSELGENALWAAGSNGSGYSWEKKIGVYTFRVQVSTVDGIPDQLSIESQGFRVSQVENEARPAFLALGTFGLSFASATERATLRCWVRPEANQ